MIQPIKDSQRLQVHCQICTLIVPSTIIVSLPQNSHSLIALLSLPVPLIPTKPIVIAGTWHFCLCSLCLLWLADCYGLWLFKSFLLFSAVNYSLLQLLLGLRHLALHVPLLVLQGLYFCS